MAEAEAGVQTTEGQWQIRVVVLDCFVVRACKCKIAMERWVEGAIVAAASVMRQTRMDVACSSSLGVDQDDVFADDRQRQDRMAGPA